MQLKKLKIGLFATVFVIGSLPFGNAVADGVTTGIDSRSRGEYTEMGNLNSVDFVGSTDDYRATQRTRVSVDGKAGDVSASVTVQANSNWGNAGNLNVYEAWAQFGTDITFRVGRQEFAMDDGRLMGTDDWNNGRSYDGVLIGYKSGDYSLDFFGARNIEVSDDPENSQLMDLLVLHPATSFSGIDVSIPIMYMSNEVDSDAEVTNIITAGLHLQSDGDFSWRLEGYFQQLSEKVPDIEATSSTAMMFSLGLGYKVNDMLAPQLNVDFTGGSAADDTEMHVFRSALANTHEFNGSGDNRRAAVGAFGGLIDLGLSNDFGEMGPGSLSVGFHYLMLADADAAGKDSAALGMEVDLDYCIEISDALHLTISEYLFIDGDEGAGDREVGIHDLTLVQLSLAL